MTDRNCWGFPGSRHGGADAGVVDQDVDPAEGAHGGVDELTTVVGAGHVGTYSDGPRPASSTSLRVATRRSFRRAPSDTSAPASARATAKATPNPLDAPVTIATRSSMRKRSRIVIAR